MSENDQLVWNLSDDGNFSFSSAYDAVRMRRSVSMVCAIIWNPLNPLKMSFLAWRVFHKVLPTDDVLASRGFYLVSKCGSCESCETLRHIFFDGESVLQVWQHYSRLVGMEFYGVTCISSALYALVFFIETW